MIKEKDTKASDAGWFAMAVLAVLALVFSYRDDVATKQRRTHPVEEKCATEPRASSPSPRRELQPDIFQIIIFGCMALGAIMACVIPFVANALAPIPSVAPTAKFEATQLNFYKAPKNAAAATKLVKKVENLYGPDHITKDAFTFKQFEYTVAFAGDPYRACVYYVRVSKEWSSHAGRCNSR